VLKAFVLWCHDYHLTPITAGELKRWLHFPPARELSGRDVLTEEEARRLRRADLVLAIQDDEGAALRRIVRDRDVVTVSEPKSISRETTFERDLSATRDRSELSRIFTSLCAGVASDLQRKGYVARTIGIKLRYEDFHIVTRDLTLPAPTADPAVIRRAAGECLRRVALEQRLRLLGVRASTLSSNDPSREPAKSPQAELPLIAPGAADNGHNGSDAGLPG